MGARASWLDGVRRVNRAPMLLAGMFGMTLLVALPLSIALGALIAAHLGTSLAADTAAGGVDFDWWQEFSSQTTGLGATFVPSIVGFGAVLDNLSRLADHEPPALAVAAVTGAWLVIWSFLSGGIIDRYARGRPTRTAGFFAACGTHFWRFARLGIVALCVYYLLFSAVHGWLFELLYPRLTREIAVERTAFFIRLACYVLFALMLALCSLLFDYSRIRVVVEDRRSAIGALLAASRFLRRHPGALRLYAINTAAYLALLAAYAFLAPGAPRSGLRMWLALGMGQLYILGRHYLKLLFYASQTAFFQRSLAHASYTAAPAVVWPESPAAEAILNAESVAS
jgi:hypothetical protein